MFPGEKPVVILVQGFIQLNSTIFYILCFYWMSSYNTIQFHIRDFAAANMIGANGLLGKSWPDLDMLPLGWLSNAGNRTCIFLSFLWQWIFSFQYSLGRGMSSIDLCLIMGCHHNALEFQNCVSSISRSRNEVVHYKAWQGYLGPGNFRSS